MMLLIAGVLLVAAVIVATFALTRSASSETGVARSLAMIEHTVAGRSAVHTAELPARERLLVPLLEKTRAIAERLSPGGTAERLARMLDQAGNPAGWSVERVLGAKGAALILGLIGGFLFGGLTMNGLLFAAGLGAGGFFLPDLLVKNTALKRAEETSHGLAEGLDMLSVCVEAGQAFDAAVLQVARNVEGPISGEFARVLSEIQIGKTRGEAFSALGERVPLAEVKNFTSAIVQADKLGLPIAAVLREQTANMRLVRRQKAEEKAQKITIKVLFPLLLCLFPALFIVILGPAVVNMVAAFSKSL